MWLRRPIFAHDGPSLLLEKAYRTEIPKRTGLVSRSLRGPLTICRLRASATCMCYSCKFLCSAERNSNTMLQNRRGLHTLPCAPLRLSVDSPPRPPALSGDSSGATGGPREPHGESRKLCGGLKSSSGELRDGLIEAQKLFSRPGK